MNRSPKIQAGEEVGKETYSEDQNVALSDAFGSRDNNHLELFTETINGQIKIEVIEVEPIFDELGNNSGEFFRENNSADYGSAFKPEDDQDSDTPRRLQNDFKSYEIGLEWCLNTKPRNTKVQLQNTPVVVLERLNLPTNRNWEFEPLLAENQELTEHNSEPVSEECLPPILYIATLDPIRESPDLQMPLLTISTKHYPVSKIPKLKSSIPEIAEFKSPELRFHASTSTNLDINTTGHPALEVPLLDDGAQEIIEPELETSKISMSGSHPLSVFTHLDRSFEQIAINIDSNLITGIQTWITGLEENPVASHMDQISEEILEFNDLGIDSNNNEDDDEPDPALIQLFSMTLSQNPGMNRKYATTSQSARNAIREKFKTAFANMDKNYDVYDAEMLRLLKLYPLELVPEEILNYYLGPLDKY